MRLIARLRPSLHAGRNPLLAAALFALLWVAALGPQARSVDAAGAYTAVIEADGDCLRMRGGPGITHPVVLCLPEGLAVQVLPGEEQGPSYLWVPITGAGLSGWVAVEYLSPLATADELAAPSIPEPAPAPAANTAPTSIPVSQPTVPTFAPTTPAVSAADIATALMSVYIPPPGQTGLVVSGGGSAHALVAAAAEGGCPVASLWANADGSGFIGYLAGAPDFVNTNWLARFPTGVPSGEALIMVCGSGAIVVQPAPTAPSAPEPAPEPTPAGPTPIPAPTGTAVPQSDVQLTYYYCQQGTIAQAIGDGGGFCGDSYAGSPVAAGLAACAPVHFGQRFRIIGDPTGQIYRCDDLGSEVFDGHRDIWFADSDAAWAWWAVVGPQAVIEVLPDLGA